jgi:UDP-N-acetylglucosamine 2-epimerase (non-hydrolysing)
VTAPIVHVVGARPNFMKAAPVIDALAARGATQHVVHTGQHYDERMSQIFFDELGIPEPDVNLGVGSGTHAQQTAALMTALEGAFSEVVPRAVVVYGDINSTVAAALVCAKLELPVVHVEAGLRSFDPSMPEEVNRRVTDVLADLLLVTSPEGLSYLADEGVAPRKAHLIGNPMIDTLLRNRGRFDADRVRSELDVPERYAVATLHRPGNVDDADAAGEVVRAVRDVAAQVPLIIPLHPRGRQRLADAGLVEGDGVRIVEPLGYVDFLSLVAGAALVLTDSGGVQEETTILDVPCLTVRPNTERPITVTHGTNRLVSPAELPGAAKEVLTGTAVFPTERPPLWDGRAGERAADLILATYPEDEVAG